LLQFVYETLPVVTTLLICGFALMKGDEPERYVSTITFVAWVSTNLIIWQKLDYHTTTNLLFAIDIVVLASLGVLAWKFARVWVILITALQALQIVIHIARDIGFKIDDHTYYYALTVSGYGQLIAMLVGTIIAWRERSALASFGIVAQPAVSSPASARSIRPSVLSTPKMATNDPKRGPWF
jgi:hypothetical protein